MTDSSTFFAKKTKIKDLHILFKGDPALINTYQALSASRKTLSDDTYGLVNKFLDFVNSESGQKIYREYGTREFGYVLYNDAKYAKKYDH